VAYNLRSTSDLSPEVFDIGNQRLEVYKEMVDENSWKMVGRDHSGEKQADTENRYRLETSADLIVGVRQQRTAVRCNSPCKKYSNRARGESSA
jgi:hypothetical protein